MLGPRSPARGTSLSSPSFESRYLSDPAGKPKGSELSECVGTIMAGRIRSIKPEFPHSESMGNCTRDARLLFLELFTLADDDGRLRGAPRMIASLLFPYDDDAPALIESWLNELDRELCIIRYTIEGAHYIQITNWLQHQKIDHPKPSRLPAPPAQEEAEPCAIPREDQREEVDTEAEDIAQDLEDTPAFENRREEERSVEKRSVGSGSGSRRGSRKGSEEKRPAEPNATPVVPAPRRKQSPPPDESDPLYTAIWQSFLAITPHFADYGREGKATKELCKKSRSFAPDAPEDFAKRVLETFSRLRGGADRFWTAQPFTPSALNSASIFDRVVQESGVFQEPELEEAFDGCENLF